MLTYCVIYVTAITLMALGCWLPAVCLAALGMLFAWRNEVKAAPAKGRDLVLRATPMPVHAARRGAR